MADIVIPNTTSDDFLLGPVEIEIYINGMRRTDGVCLDCSKSTGNTSGKATIWFPDSKYDSLICYENDILTLKAKNYGIIYRGYMTARNCNIVEKLKYTFIDYGEKFNDTFFLHEYNYEDKVTKKLLYPYSIKAIANDAYQFYLSWHNATCPNDFLLTIDLDSFPDDKNFLVGNVLNLYETHVIGQGLLAGLQQTLESVDYRYRLRVKHTNTASIITAYLLGTGYKKNISRGTRPDQPYKAQPNGIALVNSIEKQVNASNTVSHILAEGDNRIIERAMVLSQGWREVADDFHPDLVANPNDHIKNYVTITERDNVINNWEKYTTEKVTIKSQDKFNYKTLNSNYRKKYKEVACSFAIPKFDDTFFYMDDPDTYPMIMGETNRQVKIESDLVQEYDGQKLSPFLVYKRFLDDTLYLKLDGFSIKDSQKVEFSSPFVDTINRIKCKGVKGKFISYDQATLQSVYQVDDGIELNQYLTTDLANGKSWLILGEYQIPYTLDSFSSASKQITVVGNMSGAGITDDAGKVADGTHWFVVDKDPLFDCDITGLSSGGMSNGIYKISDTGSETLTNEYAGMTLILGNYNSSLGGFTETPNELKNNTYRIAYSSEKYLYIDNNKKDLTASPTHWYIADIQTETKRPFEWIVLNCAYSSVQKLQWNSGDISLLKNKRIVYKNSNEYKWSTEYANYRLTKVTNDGEQDKYTITFNNAIANKINQQNELAMWAYNQINGSNYYESKYDITLAPMDLNIEIGDRIMDNRVETGTTVTGISYDFLRCRMQITASSI